ncbi:hypothetical protein COU75_00090 [Candidatus Peregrinibacteria bacterium CG10_big_fil_rev_8_21_14_0_10_42_8]|nr:MAG: hypothetical protein COU75_00090 [Candidatus Peregrinibacteria bacterium CG10_big_fil_rev_8_21_14_0_10_42_8]
MTKTPTFPPDWDERMLPDKDSIQLWDTENLEDQERMAIERGNQRLLEICRETKSMLPKIIAVMRWSELGLTIDDAKVAVGLSGHGYKTLETDLEGRWPMFFTYEKLFQFWKNETDISLGIREQCLDLLSFPHIFEQENPKRGEIYNPQPTLLDIIEQSRSGIGHVLNHHDMNAFYHRLGYDVGHEHINDNFKGHWSRLHTRKDYGTVPPAVEVMTVVDTLYDDDPQMHALRLAEGEGLWCEIKMNQYRERGVEDLMAKLLTGIEFDTAKHWEWNYNDGNTKWSEPMTFRAEAIKEVYGLTDLPSQRLTQTEYVEWEEIEHIARGVIPTEQLDEFERDWKTDYEVEKKRQSFRSVAIEAMENRGLNYKSIADVLGLKIDDTRRQKADDERSTRDRPEAQIRQIICYNRQSSSVAIEGILRCLAQGEEEYEHIRQIYIEERKRYYKRTGAAITGDGLHMRILRELGNVSMEDLAKRFLPQKSHNDKVAIRKKDLELQKLERQEGKTHAISFEKVYAIIEKEIQKRAEEVEEAIAKLDAFPEDLKVFTSVEQMAANCIKGMKGAVYVNEAMENNTGNDAMWLRSDVVQNIAEDGFVPTLPSLRLMAKSTTDQVLPVAVIRDWYEKFPEQLQKGSPHFSHNFPVTEPLARSLCTMMSAKDASIIQFFERTQGITPTHGTKLVRDIESGDIPSNKMEWIRKIAIAAGYKPRYGDRDPSVEYRFLEELYINGQNMQKALAVVIPLLKIEKRDIHPINLPGTSLQEIEEALQMLK